MKAYTTPGKEQVQRECNKQQWSNQWVFFFLRDTNAVRSFARGNAKQCQCHDADTIGAAQAFCHNDGTSDIIVYGSMSVSGGASSSAQPTIQKMQMVKIFTGKLFLDYDDVLLPKGRQCCKLNAVASTTQAYIKIV